MDTGNKEHLLMSTCAGFCHLINLDSFGFGIPVFPWFRVFIIAFYGTTSSTLVVTEFYHYVSIISVLRQIPGVQCQARSCSSGCLPRADHRAHYWL